MSTSLTFFFKEIFETENDFLNFVIDYNVNSLNIADNLIYFKYVYKVLFRTYCNSNIQYLTPEEFKLDFANELENVWEKFKKRKELVEKIYKLSDDEILKINNTLSNQANNPNDAPDDPTKPLNYISAQVYSQLNDNKLIGYLKAIETMPELKNKELINSFKWLFKSYIPNQVFIY
ncbi:MAG: hypothetical protein J6T10_21390 [Methanobrevibacter sp.]|nr:hypothetical protein [Methanobrevibacter sp.]